MEIVTVHASGTYDIKIEKDLLYTIGEEISSIKSKCKVLIVSDDIVHDLYGKIVSDSMAQKGYNVFEYTFKQFNGVFFSLYNVIFCLLPLFTLPSKLYISVSGLLAKVIALKKSTVNSFGGD